MLQSLWLSVLLTVLGVVVQTPLSMLLGVWAAGHQRNRAVLSAVFFVPLLLSATAVSVLWRALLDPNFGVPAQASWLFGDGNLLGTPERRHRRAGLRRRLAVHPVPHPDLPGRAPAPIPQVLYQAAAIDGAGTVRQFFHITLPQLRNTIITSMILMVVGGLTTFDTVLILTQGGPGTDTTISAYYMYQQAFKSFDFGGGSAIALVLVVVATADLADRGPALRLRQDAQHRGGTVMRQRPNYLAGLGSLVWLFLVGLPLYVMLTATLRTRSDYSAARTAGLPHAPHAAQLHATTSPTASAGTSSTPSWSPRSVVAIVLLVVPPLSYAIVRSRGRITTRACSGCSCSAWRSPRRR